MTRKIAVDVEKHIAWMNREIYPACDKCGCRGNNECGHEILDHDMGCTLHPDLICPCCKFIGDPL